MTRPEAYKLVDARKVQQLEQELEKLESGQDKRIEELEEQLRQTNETLEKILTRVDLKVK